MEMMIDLPARNTLVAGIPFLNRSFKTVEDLCKLECHPFLSNPFIAQEEVTVTHLILTDRPPKKFNRAGVP
jgi:hypothetical protein